LGKTSGDFGNQKVMVEIGVQMGFLSLGVTIPPPNMVTSSPAKNGAAIMGTSPKQGDL